MFAWDGLHFPLPMAMEPVELHPGYVRLAGRGQALELRFGPEKRAFDPLRDGRRLQGGARLATTGLDLCRHPGTDSLLGILYGGERLYVYRFAEGVVTALLYSQPPGVEEVVRQVAAMAWTPQDRWRQWRCLDLAFASPPQMGLKTAKIAPGTFSITFKKKSSLLTLLRLVPADVVLGGGELADVVKKLMAGMVNQEIEVIGGDGETIEFAHRKAPVSSFLTLFPWGRGMVRGHLRLDRPSNRLLLAVERGRLMPQETYKKILESYVVEQG